MRAYVILIALLLFSAGCVGAAPVWAEEAQDRAQQALQQARTEISTLKEALAKLKTENATLSADLEKEKQRADKLDANCDTWATESKALAVLKKALASTTTQLAEQRQRADMAESKARSLERNTGIKWFLAGVLVLLFGVFLGLALRPKRQRFSRFR